MIRRYSRYLPTALVASALSAAGATSAAADEPTTAELMEQVKLLQSQVEQMQSKQQPSAQDAVAADAAQRSSFVLMQNDQPFVSGWDHGHFVLTSADGNFRLEPSLQFQFRYVFNCVEGDDGGMQDGFEVRRAKLQLRGNVFTEKLKYQLRWASHRDDAGAFDLENAFVEYEFRDKWSVRAGQYKDFVFHEEEVSSARQLAADRSLLNELLGGGQTDYLQGVSLIYNNQENYRAAATFHDGYNSDNTDFTNQGGTGFVGVMPTNWGFSARSEHLIKGNFRSYDDFTAMGNDEETLVIGFGFDWSQAGGDNVFFHTVDAQWENAGGIGVYAAYLGQWLDVDPATPGGDDSFYNWGVLVQGGYMIPDTKYEVFARYNFTQFDDTMVGVGSEDCFQEFTVGVNYYWQKHAAKFTVDVGYLPDGSPASASGIGVQASDDAELVIRGQFQLLI